MGISTSTTFTANTRSLALLSLILGVASLCRAGDITYDVDLTIGTASVTGFIETDGTISPYYQGSESHFLDYNLSLTNGTSAVDLLGPLSGDNSTANEPSTVVLLGAGIALLGLRKTKAKTKLVSK